MKGDRFEGCLLGLALGDAFGAPFEGGVLERLVWRVIGRTRTGERRFTDDTTMALDLAESLLERGELDLDDLAARFAASYRWSRGYGPGAAKLLGRLAKGDDWRTANRSVFPEGSWGNGGAMRAPVIGLALAHRPHELAEAARQQASVTHAHPLAMEGAVLVASATALGLGEAEATEILDGAAKACELEPLLLRLEIARAWLREGEPPRAKEVRLGLGNGISAKTSCVTALYLGLRFLHRDLEELLAFAARLGGDVDTISAMAGAIWGARNGAARLPDDLLSQLEGRDRLRAVARALHQVARLDGRS